MLLAEAKNAPNHHILHKVDSYNKGLVGQNINSSRSRNPDTDTKILWGLQRQFNNPYTGLIHPDQVNFLTDIEFTGERLTWPLSSHTSQILIWDKSQTNIF